MRPLIGDWARAVGSYSAILAVGVVAAMTASSAVGYLPYSDRPGPGWTEPTFSLGLVGFYLSWAVLLLFPAVTYGSVLFGVHRLLRHLGAPLPLVRASGGFMGAGSSLLAVTGAGWYIAMAAFPAWVGGALGLLWGVAVLPRYVGEDRSTVLSLGRWAAIGFVVVGSWGLLSLTFLPRRGQVLELNVVRVRADADLQANGWEENLQPAEATLLDSLALRGRMDLGFSLYSATNDQRDTARVLIVFTEALQTDVRLALPRDASVVYVQRGGDWETFPGDALMSRKRVRLEAGAQPGEILVTAPGRDPSAIRWTNDR